MAPACTVNTTEPAACAVQFKTALPLVDTLGVGDVAKKCAGWFKVTVPDVGTAPPAVGENANVTALPVLLLWRCATVMLKELNTTRSPMCPLGIFS